MIINVKNATMVRPAEEMPKRSLWVSNLDLRAPRVHTTSVYFYRSNGSSDFFSPNQIKEALSRALVSFYPISGRLSKDPDGRIEIDCNGHGVLFVEAETTSLLDDFHDFSSTSEFKILIPTVDYSGGISSYPLCVIQLTRFKCGGVSIGVGLHHLVADAFSTINFFSTWAQIGRGVDPSMTPCHDRTFLRAREPPQPKFEHIEYQPPPKVDDRYPHDMVTDRLFTLSSDQINTLKANAKKDGDLTITYTTNDVVSVHVWRCVCLACGLGDDKLKDQPARLYVPFDGRSRLQRPHCFGNVIFLAVVDATADLVANKPSRHAVTRLHQAVARMDTEYMKSAVDHLELHLDLGAHRGTPNLTITSLRWLPVYGSDFGWGAPFFMGPAGILVEGFACILPRPINDGSITFAIGLKPRLMELFQAYIYDISSR